MANRTVKDAHSVKGTNPQYLVEKIIRTRIYESKYWKEQCFALSAELLVDKAMELKYIGGVYGGNVKPTPFLCLVLKMLQIQPEKDIVIEFIRNEDFKYVRALGAYYLRLIGTSLDCYKYLEPLYNDYRKIKRQNRMGDFELVHMDEFIDELLREERACDVILPRIQKRQILEEGNELDARVSALDDDLEEFESSSEDEDMEKDVPDKRANYDLDKPRRSPSPRFRRSRSRSPRKERENRGDRDRRERRRSRSRERHRDRDRDRDRRHRSRSGDRHDRHDKDRERKHKSKREHRDKDRSHRDRDKHKSSKSSSNEDPEIAEANRQRAALGLAPLRM
ncbi:unnamed protein product [Owenia fusiformis]|uniref:Pre-mRNA-splicing factor 38 n=1 Tax=Owenia fusiformis TaxID=6347 RepID=A0A8S4MYY5_OWEFU|nr:unnamed protein product [Owenia fusiformis]